MGHNTSLPKFKIHISWCFFKTTSLYYQYESALIFIFFKHVPEKNIFSSQTIPENRTRRPLVLGLLLLDKLFFLWLSLITNLHILAFPYDENSSF